MKAQLVFNLADIDDKEMFDMACKASKAFNALYEISMYFREIRKYSQRSTTELEVFDEAETKFYEIINSNDISI